MRVALVQQTADRDHQANVRKGLKNLRRAAKEGADVVAFAELAFTRFYPQRPAGANRLDLAESVPGPTTQRFAEEAAKLGVVVVINLFERCWDVTYDTSPVIDADGTLLGVTRMAHVIEAPCFHERGYYAPGDKGMPVYDTKAGRIGVAICYDRHFPEYMRGLGLAGAELVIVPQAGVVDEWPDGLYEAELQVAAFHNGYFAALANRVGVEDKLNFAGESFAVAPDGRVLARAARGTEEVLIADLDLSELKTCHARRHFLPDRRPEVYGALTDASGPTC